MGLKSGSRESGLGESEPDSENDERADGRTEPAESVETQAESVSDERGRPESTDRSGDKKESEGVSGSEEDSVSSDVSTHEEGEERRHNEGDRSTGRAEEADKGNDSDTFEGTNESGGQFSVDSLPYKLRRQNVNDGREQVPYFLRPEITEREEGLKRTLEDDLGETVYKSDYREAAMVVAQRNPELVAEVLREWGYDLPG